MKRTAVLAAICILFVSRGLVAQGSAGVSKRGTVAAPFLNIGQGARALSMGGAFVALANDASAMYWNPAGIAGLDGINLMFDHTTWIADIQYEFLGATVSMGEWGTIGFNTTVSSVGNMKVTTIQQQEGTGEIFSVTDLAVGLSYGIRLTDAFAIGFNPKFVYQQIWKMSASAFAVDLGVQYRTPFKGFTLGMSISNFGTKMQMQGNNALVLYDADPASTGNNGRIPATLETEEWELPLNFRVGLLYDLPMDELGNLKIAVDAAHPSDDFENVNLGAEYVFDEFIYLRGGLKSLFQKDSEESFTAGVGVRQFLIGNVQVGVDYSYQEFARLKNAQKITLLLRF